jgi:hypothetical protein
VVFARYGDMPPVHLSHWSADDAVRACRVARISAALGFFGLLFDYVSSSAWVGNGHVLEMIGLAVCASCFLGMTMVRYVPTVRLGTVVFLVVNVALIAALWETAQDFAASGIRWVPFRENHLGAMTVALLAPPIAWVGIVTILGFTGAPVVQYALFDPAVRERIAYGDPWATIAFGGFALVLLVFRLHGNRKEREAAQVQARLEHVERFARTMLAVRDLANTPLQTLVLSIDLLRSADAEPAVIADRVDRAVRRLRDIDRIASAYEDVLGWPAGTQSFDAVEILRGRQ